MKYEILAKQIVMLCELDVTPQRKINVIEEMLENTVRDATKEDVVIDATSTVIHKSLKKNGISIRARAIQRIVKRMKKSHPNTKYSKLLKRACTEYDSQ